MATPAKRKTKAEDQTVPAADLLQYYRDMLLIRRFEEKAGQMYGMGLIGGFCPSTSARKPWWWACRRRSPRTTR